MAARYVNGYGRVLRKSRIAKKTKLKSVIVFWDAATSYLYIDKIGSTGLIQHVLYSKTESVPQVMCEVQSKFQKFQARTWFAPLGGSQGDYNRSCLSPEMKLKLDLLGSGDTSASCN